ncbi:MAG: group II intron reverse transcriptase/maturase [Acidobacteria bacterium]|nr:group II intron reverse transcriptase/maturase [Acidobacteriota bacterium]
MTIEEVAREENLREAFRKVALNDGAPGPDRQRVEEVGNRLAEIVPALSRDLVAGRYRPGEIRRVWIPKSGGGERGLGIPNVIDRMVQQAVAQVLSPHYEPVFHESSHGFRPGRSCHTAIAEAKKHLEEGYGTVVDLDLEKFFDRVNHERLLARLGQRVKDARLLGVIRRMLKARVVMPDGVVVATEEGTPQGGPLSPLLSNIVLDELDWELVRRGHRFVRYADDANIYVRSQRAGERVMASVRDFIERKLRLKVNLSKSAVGKPEERNFVGFRLRREPEDGSVEVDLSKRSRERVDESIRERTRRSQGRSRRAIIQELNAFLGSWIGFFWIVTGKAAERTLHSLDAHIRRRLRAVVLKHWRRRRSIVRRLIRLGCPEKKAWRTVYDGRRRLWDLSRTAAVQKSLRNEWFVKQGLFSLEAWWQQRWTREHAPVQLELGLALG